MDKKISEGEAKWKDFCIIVGLHIRMFKILMNTKFVSYVILFQNKFQYQNVIPICYGWLQVLQLFSRIRGIVQAIT
jgi:hypothetical protein